jgi:hypothetical protein
MVVAAFCTEKSDAVGLHQANALAWDGHAAFDFGTHRHEFDERAEDIIDEVISLVTAVESDLLTEQAGGNADADVVGRCVLQGCFLCA